MQTVTEKVTELTLDDKQREQVLTLMRIAYASGMGRGAAIARDKSLQHFKNPMDALGEEYIPGAFDKWANECKLPWHSIGL